jgi:hypothetical protein
MNQGTTLNEGGAGFRTIRPSVAMTTRSICIAGKGEINMANNVEAGPDTLPQTTFYTVLCHPEPKSDPTLPVGMLPGGTETVGLARIVPDQIIYNAEAANLNNWEPYISVLGDSTFLIEANTFAENTEPPNSAQRFVLAFQPAGGGDHGLGECFYSDDGMPYRNQINLSRQNGNPGRVAGDKRPGAKNFITGAEASPHGLAEFRGDTRWDLGLNRGDTDRYGTVQTFSLDPATLTQTSLSRAFDAIHGRLTMGTSAVQPEVGRFGGDAAGLDNGNFVVVVDDRSNLHAPNRAATAVIVAPDGTIVKDSFVIGAGEIWSNVAAYRGGFCVRLGGVLYFFDNDGNPTGNVDQGTAGVNFDRGRGDGTRIASHVNTPYVYLAGQAVDPATTINAVRVAAFDSRTASFVSVINVSELTEANGGTDPVDFRPVFDRVNLAVDACDRLTVAYEARPAEFLLSQIAARMLAFDGVSGKFQYLTESFFAFANYGATLNEGGAGFRTIRPSVAMTTRSICIAGKGEINMANNVAAGPDTLPQTTFYTVFSHPCPKDDPTPPATPPATRFTGITRNGNMVTIRWSGGTGPFTVQKKATLSDANWVDVAMTSMREATVPIEGNTGFFRVADQVRFQVTLNGASERPTPVDTPGMGSGTLVLDGNKLTVNITYSGLLANANNAHIHGPATVDQFAGVLQGLNNLHVGPFSTSGTFSGSVTLNSATVNHMLNELTYVNIHSTMHPGGEIRGQVVRISP